MLMFMKESKKKILDNIVVAIAIGTLACAAITTFLN